MLIGDHTTLQATGAKATPVTTGSDTRQAHQTRQGLYVSPTKHKFDWRLLTWPPPPQNHVWEMIKEAIGLVAPPQKSLTDGVKILRGVHQAKHFQNHSQEMI